MQYSSVLVLLCAILMLCALPALAQVPIAYSDIPRALPENGISASVSRDAKGHAVLSTSWQPAFGNASAMLFTSVDTVYLQQQPDGTFVSLATVATPLDTFDSVYMSAYSDDESSSETLRVQGDGTLSSYEYMEDGSLFRYAVDSSGQGSYHYTVADTTSDMPRVAYSVTFAQDRSVMGYILPEGEDMEVHYDGQDRVTGVDALVPSGEGGYRRINWDFEKNAWVDPTTHQVIDREPYIAPSPTQAPAEETVPPAPTPSPEATGTSSEATPAPEKDALYLVKAPPVEVSELQLAYPAGELKHIKLGKTTRAGSAMELENLGYTRAELVETRADGETVRTEMSLSGSVWTAPAGEGSTFGFILTGPDGTVSVYDREGKPTTMRQADPSLVLQPAGTYEYNGNGKENVLATYSARGTLTAYSYRNAENTKRVSYDPYGTLLFYSAPSQDGRLYRYDPDRGWETRTGENTWEKAEKPADVNPSDLPPLLKLERKNRASYTWFPNNTVGIIGISLRDRYPSLTRKWYNVIPVRLAEDGVQTFKLVASNAFYIGLAHVVVSGDSVTVVYELPDSRLNDVFLKDECLMWFTSVDQITTEFLEDPHSSLQFGEPLSREKDLQGADYALLFICNHVTYRIPLNNHGGTLVRFYQNIPSVLEHRKQAEALLTLMEQGAH